MSFLWDHRGQPCHMPGRCHRLVPQVCNGEGVWHLFLVLDNICSHLSSHLTMTHCVGSMQRVITITFSTERHHWANQAWFCKPMMFSSRDRWRRSRIPFTWVKSKLKDHDVVTKFNSKHDTKGWSTDVCFLWTFNILQCKISVLLLWTGAELISLTATWRGLNDF